MMDLRRLAAIMGGEITGPDSILAPGPGHSPKDRSLSVKLLKGGEILVPTALRAMTGGVAEITSGL